MNVFNINGDHLSIMKKHKWLSMKRQQSFKQDLIIRSVVLTGILFMIVYTLQFIRLCDLSIMNFIFSTLLTVDFCLRFLFKSNQSVSILPYLCLPIKKHTLISYIVIADLFRLWIWGCLLVYLFVLHQSGYFSYCNHIVLSCITLLVIILCNNYLICLIKTFMKGYDLLIFPFCLIVFIIIQFLLFNSNPVKILFLFCFLLILVVIMLNTMLRNNLYKELNEFAF
jgi:hypothetical protein